MITLPWVRRRMEVEAARDAAAAAAAAAEDAKRRKSAAYRRVDHARTTSNFAQRQLDKNGFTELLQASMGRGHASG